MGSGKGQTKRVNAKIKPQDLDNFNIKNLSTSELKSLLLWQSIQSSVNLDSANQSVEEASKQASQGMQNIQKALTLAEVLHKHDKRSNGPYIDHLLRCTVRLNKYFGVTDPDLICAALLHDAVEDHSKELGVMADDETSSPDSGVNYFIMAPGLNKPASYIAYRLNDRIAKTVVAVTNPTFTGSNKQERDAEYVDHVTEAIKNYDAFMIKFSDFNDNALGLHFTHGAGRMVSLAKKYAPLYDVFINQAEIFHKSGELSEPIYKEIKKRLEVGKEKNAVYLQY